MNATQQPHVGVGGGGQAPLMETSPSAFPMRPSVLPEEEMRVLVGWRGEVRKRCVCVCVCVAMGWGKNSGSETPHWPLNLVAGQGGGLGRLYTQQMG